MDNRDFIRQQLESSAAPEHPMAITRIVATYWPGGTADCAQPIALGWLRRWRPATANLPLPACSCAGGHCPVCN